MGKRVKPPQSVNNKRIGNKTCKSVSVKNNTSLKDYSGLLFSFSNFKFYPINIKGVFNNYYKAEEDYIRIVSNILENGLPTLSNENEQLFSDVTKLNLLHIHKIERKDDILRQIFKEYGFNEIQINNMVEGLNIYQYEIPNENGASRFVFEKSGNIISFLFLDTNHHIYMNKSIVDGNNSLFYEYCPVYKSDQCTRMDYILGTCIAVDYIDKDKYRNSFDYSYSPTHSEITKD